MPADTPETHSQRLAREVREHAMETTKPFLDLAKRKAADTPDMVPLAFHCESARLIPLLRAEAERLGKGVPTDEPGFHKDLWTAAHIIEQAEAAFTFKQQMDALSASPLGASGEGALAPLVPTEQAGQPVVGLMEGLGAILDLSNPCVRIESPRLNLDKVWDIAHDLLTAAAPSTTSTAEQPMKLLVDQAWLDRRVENDPELPCEASPSPGEGEAPVAWLIPGIERDMVELDGSPVVSEAKARGFEVRPLFTRPTPATPEGLRSTSDEALVAAMLQMAERAAEREEPGFWQDRAREHVANMRARPITDPEVQKALAEARLFLSALPPQAQGGDR